MLMMWFLGGYWLVILGFDVGRLLVLGWGVFVCVFVVVGRVVIRLVGERYGFKGRLELVRVLIGILVM